MTPIERLNLFIDEDRIVREVWHGTDDHGRETACLLGALAPWLESPGKCPARIMPAWLAWLTPWMGDHGSEAKWPSMIRRYGAAARGWHVLDDAAWRRVLARTMLAALEIAAAHDPSPSCRNVAELWRRVLEGVEPSLAEWMAAAAVEASPSCRNVAELWRRVLEGVEPSRAEWMVAAAVEAAAVVASLVEEAASLAAAAAAVEAARWAAAAEEAAPEARGEAAVCDRITDICLSAIEEETRWGGQRLRC